MNALRAYRALLENRALTRLLAGEFVSSIGDWLYLVALLIVVYQHSQDAVLLGIVGAARVLPYVLLSVPAGIAADRFDRRLILVITDVARALIMLAIAWLVATDGPIEAIVALAIFATCFSTFFGPTIGAYLPTLVQDERQLGPANSAYSTLDNLAFVLGPALAGILVGTGGLALAFGLNAVSFAVVAIILWRLPSPTREGGRAPTVALRSADASAEPGPMDAVPVEAGPMEAVSAETGPMDAVPAEGGSLDAMPTAGNSGSGAPEVRRRVGAGFSVSAVTGLALIDVVDRFAFGGIGVLTVILATSTYGSGEAGTGYLNAAAGAGGLLGALISGALVLRPSLGAAIVGSAAAMGIGLAGLGFAGSLTLALGAMVLVSAGSVLLEVVNETIFLRAVPDAIRGRVNGAIITASVLAFAGGAFAVPILSDRFGVPIVLTALALAVGLTAVAGRVLVGSVASRPASPFESTLARAASLPIFSGVSPAGLELALGKLAARPTSPGQRVIAQGEPADRFYIVDQGHFRVTQRDEGGDERALREMGPGQVFGEIGLLRSSPRTASVTAMDDGLVLALDRDDFLNLVASDNALGSRLLNLRTSAGAELHAEGTRVSGS